MSADAEELTNIFESHGITRAESPKCDSLGWSKAEPQVTVRNKLILPRP
jgi:hypothetical protein